MMMIEDNDRTQNVNTNITRYSVLITPSTASCLRRYSSSRQRDGDIYANRTEGGCRALCFGRQECAGVTYNDVTGGCFVHRETRRTSHNGDTCCVHYKRILCPLGMIKN